MSNTRTAELESYDREAIVSLINSLAIIGAKERRFPELVDRESKKKVLDRLGVNADTRKDFRLLWYSDAAQQVLFKARVAPDGHWTLTESMIVPERKAVDDDVRVSALIQGKFNVLPKPIEISAKSVRVQQLRMDVPGGPAEKLELPQEQLRKLEADVTLLALAQRIDRSAPVEHHGNHGLPNSLGRSPGRTT